MDCPGSFSGVHEPLDTIPYHLELALRQKGERPSPQREFCLAKEIGILAVTVVSRCFILPSRFLRTRLALYKGRLFLGSLTHTLKLFFGKFSEYQFWHEQDRRKSSGHEATAVLRRISVRIQWNHSWTPKPTKQMIPARGPQTLILCNLCFAISGLQV